PEALEELLETLSVLDTCAAEFEAYTPYYYSTYESEDETRQGSKSKVMILGGGPNRIGQGIEFDYCCVQAAFALREEGYECIMVNSNPETVSTDYDTSDRLYFEPITREDVLNIIDRENPDGVILQFGGQTPLNLALPLLEAGVKILGTSPDSIDRAEDRERFQELLQSLGLRQPDNGTARSVAEAHEIASSIGYPVLVRPSYVLGGRAMEVVYDADELDTYMTMAVKASSEHPVLIDRFLEDAVEFDVDAISDGETVIVGGIMEHIEEAGIHSGDSACVIPPITLGHDIQEEIRRATKALGLELGVLGLMNIQYAVKDGTLYVLEVNPRASRTVPFVSKAIGAPLAKLATKVILGKPLAAMGFKHSIEPRHFAVKEAVFPFSRFPGADVSFGPEMKSTGEVMGIDHTFDMAFAKAQLGASQTLPHEGTVFVSFKDRDKIPMVPICRKFAGLGFSLIATRGTAKLLMDNGIAVETVKKISEGRPSVVDCILNGEIQLIINTYSGKTPRRDETQIRSAAIAHRIPLFTTVAEAASVARGIDTLIKNNMQVRTIQAYHVYSKTLS
ncbi:carbamoyl-phosphate synthase large subunit, partial [Thermodesulfobacteriota bacterium]